MAVFTKLNQADISNVQNIFGFKKIKKSKMFFRKSFEYIYENTRFS